MASYKANYSPSEKRDFARKLRKKMNAQGITGAELARAASLHLPARSKPIPRQSVTGWLTGTIPDAPTLYAVAQVLDMPPEALLPRMHDLALGEPDLGLPDEELDVRYSRIGAGMMKLNINGPVPIDIGKKVVALLVDVIGSKSDR